MAFIVRKLGATVELRYHDVPIFANARALSVIAAIMRDHLELAATDVAGFISDEAPVNTGALSQSFQAEVTGTTIEDLEGRVFSPLAYAIVMDQGRAPGATMPPIDAIRLWVQRKKIAVKANTNVGALSKMDQESELDSIAWAIARSIQRKGIEGRQFVAAGWARAERRVEGVFDIMAEAIAIALVTEGSGSGSPAAAGGRGSTSRPPISGGGSRYL